MFAYAVVFAFIVLAVAVAYTFDRLVTEVRGLYNEVCRLEDRLIQNWDYYENRLDILAGDIRAIVTPTTKPKKEVKRAKAK